MDVLDDRHLGRGRQQIVDERGGERVALLVPREVLEEHAADALHRAAGDLTLDDVRVDHRPAVLGDDVAQQLDLAGFDVDLAGAHVGGVGPDAERFGAVAGARLEAHRHVGRELVLAEVGEVGDLGHRHARRRRPLDRGETTLDHDVVGRRFEHVGGDRRDPLAQDRGRVADGTGDHRAAAAAAGPRAVRRERGVALDRVDGRDVDAERVGGQLDRRRLQAVAGRAAGQVHADGARWVRCGSSRPRCPCSAMPLAVGST